MIAASLLLITNHALFPILLGWLLAAAAIAVICLYNRRRIHQHGTHV